MGAKNRVMKAIVYAVVVAGLGVLSACGASSGGTTAGTATQDPTTVQGVSTPSQISVVTAK